MASSTRLVTDSFPKTKKRKETGGDVFVGGCVAAPSPYMDTLSECHKIFISGDTTAINVDNFQPFKLLHFLSTVV